MAKQRGRGKEGAKSPREGDQLLITTEGEIGFMSRRCERKKEGRQDPLFRLEIMDEGALSGD